MEVPRGRKGWGRGRAAGAAQPRAAAPADGGSSAFLEDRERGRAQESLRRVG